MMVMETVTEKYGGESFLRSRARLIFTFSQFSFLFVGTKGSVSYREIFNVNTVQL